MPIDSIMDISASGLDFQRKRMEAIANNIANAYVTRGAEGSLYQAIDVIAYTGQADSLEGLQLQGTSLQGIDHYEMVERESDPRKVFEPAHPHADAEGFVEYPNVDPITEMTTMMITTRAYEANIKALNAAKAMAMKALEIGK